MGGLILQQGRGLKPEQGGWAPVIPLTLTAVESSRLKQHNNTHNYRLVTTEFGSHDSQACHHYTVAIGSHKCKQCQREDVDCHELNANRLQLYQLQHLHWNALHWNITNCALKRARCGICVKLQLATRLIPTTYNPHLRYLLYTVYTVHTVYTVYTVGCVAHWLRGSVVERRSLTGELSLSCARPVADGWPLMWVNRPL